MTLALSARMQSHGPLSASCLLACPNAHFVLRLGGPNGSGCSKYRCAWAQTLHVFVVVTSLPAMVRQNFTFASSRELFAAQQVTMLYRLWSPSLWFALLWIFVAVKDVPVCIPDVG